MHHCSVNVLQLCSSEVMASVFPADARSEGVFRSDATTKGTNKICLADAELANKTGRTDDRREIK